MWQIWWPNNLQIFAFSLDLFVKLQVGHRQTAAWIDQGACFVARRLPNQQGSLHWCHPYPSPGTQNREKILWENRVNKCLLEDIMNEQMPEISIIFQASISTGQLCAKDHSYETHYSIPPMAPLAQETGQREKEWLLEGKWVQLIQPPKIGNHPTSEHWRSYPFIKDIFSCDPVESSHNFIILSKKIEEFDTTLRLIPYWFFFYKFYTPENKQMSPEKEWLEVGRISFLLKWPPFLGDIRSFSRGRFFVDHQRYQSHPNFELESWKTSCKEDICSSRFCICFSVAISWACWKDGYPWTYRGPSILG